jgi:hypothetical protein
MCTTKMISLLLDPSEREKSISEPLPSAFGSPGDFRDEREVRCTENGQRLVYYRSTNFCYLKRVIVDRRSIEATNTHASKRRVLPCHIAYRLSPCASVDGQAAEAQKRWTGNRNTGSGEKARRSCRLPGWRAPIDQPPTTLDI